MNKEGKKGKVNMTHDEHPPTQIPQPLQISRLELKLRQRNATYSTTKDR